MAGQTERAFDMPAGLRPADSLNQLRTPLGIPNDSISSKCALNKHLLELFDRAGSLAVKIETFHSFYYSRTALADKKTLFNKISSNDPLSKAEKIAAFPMRHVLRHCANFRGNNWQATCKRFDNSQTKGLESCRR